jgi:hypothetical protein
MKRWMSLSPRERRAFVAAFASQVAIAVALRSLPLSAVRRALARSSTLTRRAATAAEDPALLSLLTWAAGASGRRLGPVSTCLTRTLAVQWLAARRGVVVPIHIGVRRAGALDAHAWIGDKATDDARYAPLASFEGRT